MFNDGDSFPTGAPGSEPWSEASVVLPCWSVALFWTSLVVVAFASLKVKDRIYAYNFV